MDFFQKKKKETKLYKYSIVFDCSISEKEKDSVASLKKRATLESILLFEKNHKIMHGYNRKTG